MVLKTGPFSGSLDRLVKNGASRPDRLFSPLVKPRRSHALRLRLSSRLQPCLRTQWLFFNSLLKSCLLLKGCAAVDHHRKILIEVVYKADYCLPCVYMDETVREILPRYVDQVDYRRIDFMKGAGKERFMELSYALFGKEAVHKHMRVAPIPSLFIDGDLCFDAIPPMFELEEAIEEAIARTAACNPEEKIGK